jgi:hypothetical protein
VTGGERLQRGATVVLLACLAIFGLATIWFLGTGRELDEALPRWIGLTILGSIITPVFCVGTLLAGKVLRRGEMPVLMTVSVLASIGAVAAWLFMAAHSMRHEAEVVLKTLKVAATCTILGLGLPIAGVLMTSPHGRKPLVACRAIVLSMGTLAGAAALLMMWSRWWQSRTFVLGIVLAVGLAGTILGFVALLGATWSVRRAGRVAPGSLPGRPRLELRCPDCGEQQTMSAGIERCRRCGLTIMIDVEEPRCACGYLLFNLQGDECPECGRKVGGNIREDAHAELERAGSVSDEDRELLRQIMADIRKLLEQPAPPEPSPEHRTTIEGLEKSVWRFEEDHPKLTTLLGQLVDGLGRTFR